MDLNGLTPQLSLPGGIETLIRKDFDPKDYIKSLLKIHSLDGICTLLTKEVCKVQNKLTTSVRNYYEDFATLSFDLHELTKEIAAHRNALAKCLAFSSALSTKVEGHLKKMRTLVLSRHITQFQILKEKILLHVYSTLQMDNQTLFSLEVESEETQHFNPMLPTYLHILAADIVLAKQITNVLNQEEYQLDASLSHVDPIESIPMRDNCQVYDKCLTSLVECIEDLQKRTLKVLIHAFSEELKHLYQTFHHDVQPPHDEIPQEACCEAKQEYHRSSLHPLCSGLILLNQQQEIHSAIRRVVMDPYLNQTKTKCFDQRIDLRSTMAYQQGEHATTLVEFLSFVRRTLAPTLYHLFPLFNTSRPIQLKTDQEMCQAENKEEHISEAQKNNGDLFQQLCIAQFCVLIPLIQTLTKHFDKEFIPIYPERFVQNFLVTHDFFDHLMDTLLSPKEKHEFRQNKIWMDFTTSWKTQVYENQRSKSLLNQLKMDLVGCTPVEIPLGLTSRYELESTFHLHKHLGYVIQPQQFIPREYPRVLKCIGQMAFLYKNYILMHLDKRLKLANERDESPQAIFWNKQRCCVIRDFRVLEQDFGETMENDANLLTQVLRDAKTHDLTCSWIGPTPRDADERQEHVNQRLEYIKAVFRTISQMFLKERTKLQEGLMLCITAKVRDILQAMRGVSSVFRMTDQQFKGEPSTYIYALQEPLHCLIWLRKFEDACLNKWINEIIDTLFGIYEHCLRNVVSLLDVQEESLRRLHSSSLSHPSDGSNKEPMALQIHLNKSRQQTKQQLFFDGNTFQKSCLDIACCFQTVPRPGFEAFSSLLNSNVFQEETA